MPEETNRIKNGVPERLSRTGLLLGAEGVERLSQIGRASCRERVF